MTTWRPLTTRFMKLWASTSGTRHGTRTTRSREASAGTTSSALVTAPPTRQTQPPLVRQWAPRRKCGKSAPRRRSSKTLLFLRAFLAFVRRRPPVELLSAVLRAVACSAPPPFALLHHITCVACCPPSLAALMRVTLWLTSPLAVVP